MKAILITCFVFFNASTVSSQVNITSLTLNSGGSFIEKGDYMISGNIGEMSLVNTFFTTDFIITNGLLQPLVIKKSVNENISSQTLKIYPTFTSSNVVYLESCLEVFSVCKIKVHNSIGQAYKEKTMSLENKTQISKIDLGGIGVGSYFIEIILFNKNGLRYHNQVFKIQKN